ncbi:MAG: phosphatidylglycerophosphatase A family protein [Planctomycetota bacterium]
MARPDRLRLLVATGLGLGYVPIAPGTVGSLAALPLVALVWGAGGPWAVVGGGAIAIAIGMWACGAAETRFGRRDPGAVVIDEIAGQMVSLFFLAPTPRTLVIGFVLFRAFDIWKPFPIRRVERLPGASGIMADDLLAGVLANLVLHALRWGFPGWW